MKKLLTAVALLAGLLLAGCDPDSSGEVIDKDYKYFGTYPDDYFIWRIQIEGVVAHNRVIWWKEVPHDIWLNCQVGERWDADDPDGCDPDR